MTGVEASCPQCGAPLRFGGAASVAIACPYCRSSVLRAGARLELAGKVPDLVAVDTRLALGATGRAGGRPFTVLGRVQLSRGDATWNEWYVDAGGAPGWLAEAQGRVFATRRIDPGAEPIPPLAVLRPGGPVSVPVAGVVTVDEVAEAALASYEGELPFTPRVGERYRYADATGDGGAFVTLDYGGEGDDPVLYAGRELDWSEVAFEGVPPPAAGPAGRALACPRCGAPVSLYDPASRAVTCPACRSLLDVRGGDLAWVAELKGRESPVIPLGAKGVLGGEALEAIGWLRRSSRIDGDVYRWEEVLLHGARGYRWLSVYDGHWLLLAPCAAGAVQVVGARARSAGRTFKHFQTANATVEELQGEFYWELRAGETVETSDFVAPPFLLSVERTAGEDAWTRGEYVPGDEVWKAFALPGRPPRPRGVGSAQPNPWMARAGAAWKVAAIAVLALSIAAVVLAARAPREVVAALDVPLLGSPVTLSEPFEVGGGRQALAVEASADVSQAWVGLDVALIDDATGESELVGLELSHYSGWDSDGGWQEGSRRGTAIIGRVPAGRYVLRVEPVAESQAGGRLPATAQVTVVRGVFLAAPLVLAFFLVLAWPVLATLLAMSFERSRWAESDHPWGEG